MRDLRAFNDRTQPFTVVVCFDATTHTPSFALTNYGVHVADRLSIICMGVEIPLYLQIDNVSVTSARPQSNGGLKRMSARFDVTFVGPFAISPFTKTLYSAGTNVDSVYFGIWTTDYRQSITDVNNGAFFGYYKLDANVTWAENSLRTSINLIGILELQAGRYNTVMEDSEKLIDGSEYSDILSAPAYMGYRGKVKCVGRTNTTVADYTNVAKTAVKAVIGGLVQSSTLSGTSINLGRSPTLATLVSHTVKLKMGNGCIISGTITDLGGGEYGINTTGLQLNRKWDTITVSQIGTGEVGEPLTSACNPNLITLAEAVDKIPSPTMYLKSAGAVSFYPYPTVTPGSMFVRLNGMAEEATKRFNIEDFTYEDASHVIHNRTCVNVEYDATQQTAVFSGTDAHLNYAKWLAPQSYDLYFTDKTYVLADIQKTGMPWELIVTPYVNNTVAVTYDYYLKLIGDTTIAANAKGVLNLYYDNGTEVVAIPSANITSVTYDCGDFTAPNLCRIRLKKRPSDIADNYANGHLYADLGPTRYAGELLTYIFEQAGLTAIAGPHITSALNKCGNIMSMAIKDETWGVLIDSILYEAGCTLNWVAGKADLAPTFGSALMSTWTRGVSGENYYKVETKANIKYEDIIDGTVQLAVGRTYTTTDTDGREFVRVYYDFSYQYSEYGGELRRKFRSNKTAKNNDRMISYDFKHISDTDTAKAAIVQMARIGHAANIPDTARIYEFNLTYDYAKLEALDVVTLKNFRHVSALDEPLVAYSDDTTNPVYTYGDEGYVYCKYTSDVPYMLTPGLCVVEEITYDFGIDAVPVSIKLKQVQFSTDTNVREVAEALVLPTTEENTEASATDSNNAQLLNLPTVTCALGTYHVDVDPGTPSATTSVNNDACCDIVSTDTQTYQDTTVTVTCGSWPDFCSPMNASFYYEARTDNEVGSTDTLIFDIYVDVDDTIGDDPISYALCEFKYDGMLDNPGCAVLALTSTATGAASGPMTHEPIATVAVYPCIFNTPRNQYSKNVEVVFCIRDCWNDPLTGVFSTPWESPVTIPITLKPVSDITLG